MSEPTQKPCILVVDDDGSVLVSLALLLKQSGFEVLSCDDPGQVPGLLASRRVDLVLQDMNFSPRTSGEEGLALLAEIKARQPALPVLLMTCTLPWLVVVPLTSPTAATATSLAVTLADTSPPLVTWTAPWLMVEPLTSPPAFRVLVAPASWPRSV